MLPALHQPEPGRHGTLRDVVERLDYVARLGFDVLYLPPIHPIGDDQPEGDEQRAPAPAPDDVGKPLGHRLGRGRPHRDRPGARDHRGLRPPRDAAPDRGIELALDIAFQCSPDHPWVREHPELVPHRPDGSIQCAENPPKRYEDIYPIDFDTEDRDALWRPCSASSSSGSSHGVRVFRVDNPHTKPFAFWEWLIGSGQGATIPR